jgi:hypothetical protein
VTKGSKGLMILAPFTRRAEVAEDPDGVREPSGNEAAERQLVGFRPVFVWDISQTSGDPLPESPSPQLLAGEAPAGLWDHLESRCRAAGFTVDRHPIAGDAGPNGFTSFAARKVVVRSDVDDAQAVKTLAHELGHVLMHGTDGVDAGSAVPCRGTEEVEAESVAFLVAAEYGLDTSEYTFPYVTGWAILAVNTRLLMAIRRMGILGFPGPRCPLMTMTTLKYY